MSVTVRRYRIVAGKHHTGTGITYKQGDVLESTRQLDKLFLNKFVEVSDITPITAQPDPDGVPPARDPSTLTQVTGAAVLLEKRLAEALERIATQDNTIKLMQVSLQEAEAIQQKLDIATKELDAASLRIADLEKQLKAATKKPAKGDAAKPDPFDKE